ncbi:UTP--glucose-1-phosphate uridylyltransferase-like isoform X2 [Zophobas morio]|uniref:UTP--glucose-1-phosphate uridylyltransferase-like isoform X2 n=1 Tax=Zophobas morio TaxID=2755281 RepID=UPI003083993B
MGKIKRKDSLSDFKAITRSSALECLSLHISKLIETAKNKEEVALELKRFEELYHRFLVLQDSKIDWRKIQPPEQGLVHNHESLDDPPLERATEMLNKLVVVKLNGGLGTTMGCTGPKSAIEVREEMTFLDLTVQQVKWLNYTYNCNVPLVLMNSFNTHEETERIIGKYKGALVQILTFNQARYPRIDKETLLPCASDYEEDDSEWYPPGHGDIYFALKYSGLLDSFLKEEYIFISNIDNLGATVDLKILNYLANSDCEFLMEVTNKTMADVKGGTLISYEGHSQLLELAQVPKNHVDEFKSIKKFRIFNTNNLWLKLKAIKRVLAKDDFDLDIIVNEKRVKGNQKIIQLETAVGASIKYFNTAKGINVPRSRFLPVKTTSDLLLVKSNLYSLKHGGLLMNPERPFPEVPLIKLGEEHFKNVQHFLQRIPNIPNIIELDHLTVTGDVTFGFDVVLKGTVIIVANHGERIDIPSGAILENKVITGNLRILDH